MSDLNIAAAVQNQIGARNAVTQTLPLIGALVKNGVGMTPGLNVIHDWLALQGAQQQLIDQLHQDITNYYVALSPAQQPVSILDGSPA